MMAQMLAPGAVLILWSLVMLVWMGATRLPAMRKMGGLGQAKPGGRGQDLEGVLDDRINWKAHNYAHLMEQPTLFYAICLALALLGAGNGMNATIAWAYVGLRVLHSIVQATFNKVSVRFALFVLSTLALIALTLHAGIALLHQA